jgi:hypothetical protein
MSQSKSKESEQGFHPVKALLRESRDGLLNVLAEVKLRVASSRPYFVISSALSRPALLATALSRKLTTAATSQILAQMNMSNMPSREDLLALSKRLNRMEMLLDDISAAMDASATVMAAGKSRVGLRQPQRDGDGHGNGAAKAG